MKLKRTHFFLLTLFTIGVIVAFNYFTNYTTKINHVATNGEDLIITKGGQPNIYFSTYNNHLEPIGFKLYPAFRFAFNGDVFGYIDEAGRVCARVNFFASPTCSDEVMYKSKYELNGKPYPDISSSVANVAPTSDSKFIAFTQFGNTYITSLETGSETIIPTANNLSIYQVSYSADDQYLAIQYLNNDWDFQLNVYETTGYTQVFEDHELIGYTWSPTGHTLVMSVDTRSGNTPRIDTVTEFGQIATINSKSSISMLCPIEIETAPVYFDADTVAIVCQGEKIDNGQYSHRIVLYNLDGTFTLSLEKSFDNPIGSLIMYDGKLYVKSYGNLGIDLIRVY